MMAHKRQTQTFFRSWPSYEKKFSKLFISPALATAAVTDLPSGGLYENACSFEASLLKPNFRLGQPWSLPCYNLNVSRRLFQ
jgi:hypothetical protein